MEEKTNPGISGDAMERISERLSPLENLYFPRALQSAAADPSQRKAIFSDLLSRDVALFLERYGSLLTSNELREFDALKSDYEINWHLKRLWSIMSPTSEELRMRSVTVKNRRRAYLDKLMCDGDYFSEDAMREREPYLHHEYVGRFQDQSGRGMARPGERWSETLMRRSEEAFLVAKIRGEQQRLGVAERDWIGNERIQEEEERRNVTRDRHPTAAHLNHSDDPSDQTRENEESSLSPEELQDRLNQFTYIMQQKFLLGEDQEHLDYSRIDNDETLDDHWQREANVDAEEKYFADD
ncbi:coiled-coil domain-containing protein 97-like isoform X2 [Neltuma alba]|uniref:coiled-coil domain-containing protein 97-like isoform X2 n=1 Tax=Neltuma alba TaxID=207710 RepID=UPI0010A55ABC|nr:coiled-coil domain-containing protein 97-like isoform X2 [Prosopis alba]